MKKKDWLIMSYLRQNARMSLTNMSKKTHVPISTIYDRIKLYQESIIQQYSALLDFTQLGFNTKANVLLKSTKTNKAALLSYLDKHPHVNSLYKVNNGYDLLAQCIFPHIRDLEEFIELVEEKFDILKKQMHYLITDVKQETFLSDPDLLPSINFK